MDNGNARDSRYQNLGVNKALPLNFSTPLSVTDSLKGDKDPQHATVYRLFPFKERPISKFI